MSPKTKTKLFLFALTLASVGLLGACGSKSSSSQLDAPAPVVPVTTEQGSKIPSVGDATEFDGQPGQFAALYTGTCVVEADGRSYTNCSTRVVVKQKFASLSIRTTFFLNPTNHGPATAQIVGTSEDTFTVSGKSLMVTRGSEQTRVGVIGSQGFGFLHAGQPYRFIRRYFNNSEYAGTFVDGSGRTVSVTGHLQRGSVPQPSVKKLNNLNRAK